MKHSRSVDVSATRLPDILLARRTERGWSKADLAAAAGLSAKVIHQIETRSRDRFFEKTLLLLAEALQTSLEDLLQPRDAEAAPDGPAAGPVAPPEARAGRRRTPGRLLLLAAAALLIAAVPAVIGALRQPVQPQVSRGVRSVQAVHPVNGKLLWSRAFEATVNFADPSPWNDGSMIVGLNGDGPDGGRVLLLDAGSGRTIWDRSPDAALAARAFGEAVLAGIASFGPIVHRAVDLAGDGEPELAVSFMHMRNYPSSVLFIDRRGEVVGEYVNRGHVYDLLAVDLDDDGRQELVCVGCNNHERFGSGAVFVLDLEHCRGAAVDPLNGGNLEVADGARGRILLPSLEPQMLAWLGVARIAAYRVQAVQATGGALSLLVTVGFVGLDMHLVLDADLNPLALMPTDVTPVTVATWPVDDPDHYGPNCPEWRDRWLQGIVKVTDRGRLLVARD